MSRQYAVKFNKRQVEFISCINMIERFKKARPLTNGVTHMGVKRVVVSECGSGAGKKTYFTIKDYV